MDNQGGKKTARTRSVAKVNLDLYVTARRPDGYHELDSLFCPVGLYDEVAVTLEPGPTTPVSVLCGMPGVPEDSSNLAARAAEAFYSALGKRAATQITLKKNIPPGAGLGGGSSNAAAVLNLLNRLWERPFSNNQLEKVALGLGADVPFFITSRPAVARGVGERLTPAPPLPPMDLVIVFPGVFVSTAQVYKNYTLTLTSPQKIHRLPILDDKEAVVSQLQNDLEPAARKLCPEIGRAQKALMETGAMAASMTGSGSAVFGVFSGPQTAEAAERSISSRHGNWKIFCVPAPV